MEPSFPNLPSIEIQKQMSDEELAELALDLMEWSNERKFSPQERSVLKYTFKKKESS